VRKGEPLCLAMIDVDHFKQYNDHYGHGAGDEALRKIARVLVETARRPYDLAARYGGEEFVLLMPGDTEFDRILEQLRLAVAALAIDHAMSNTADVLTISCGAMIADAPQAKNPQMLLQQADLMLYQAKRAGRNRVLVERVGPDSK
jgi:diguanylate cyclase (GGDEF)-like protein